MPVDILLDKARRILRTHASGFVAIADFIDSMEKTLQLLDSGAIDETWGQIIDLTDVSSVEDLSEADVTHIASNSPWPAGVRRAIVVTDERTMALAGIYQAFGSEKGHLIKLVESIEIAEQWVAQEQPGTASDQSSP